MYAYMKCFQGEIRMSKRRGEEIFRSQCPVFDCNNTELCTWHHYGCPNFSKVFLSDCGIIRCENCGMNEEFFNIKFDCGYHDGENESLRFKYPTNLKKVYAVIGALEDDGILSFDFVENLTKSLKAQYKKSLAIKKEKEKIQKKIKQIINLGKKIMMLMKIFKNYIKLIIDNYIYFKN